MTAPDPRVGEIEARLSKATPGPWVEFHENGTPGQIEAFNCPPATGALLIDYADWDQKQKDANFIANSPADIAYLLAELRDRDEKLARVEALHQVAYKAVEPWAEGYRFTGEHCAFDGEHWPCATIAAVAAAGGGGDRG